MNDDVPDNLLDDLDTINELTKFDKKNRGFKPEIFAQSGTSKTPRGNVVEQDPTVVHCSKFVGGKRQEFVPEPLKIVTVFRDILFDVSFRL